MGQRLKLQGAPHHAITSPASERRPSPLGWNAVTAAGGLAPTPRLPGGSRFENAF